MAATLITTQPQPTKATKKGKGKAKTATKHTSTPPKSFPESEETWNSWNWSCLTDPSSSKIPPVFTKDGSYFFSLVGSTVKIHSSTTGVVVSTLVPPSPSNEASGLLTCALLNPHNAFQLLTGSLDGRIMIWDFVNGALLQTINIGQPIQFICAHQQMKDRVFVAASRPQKAAASSSDTNAAVLQVSINKQSGKSPVICAVGKTRAPTGLAISSNGLWLVATAAHKVYIAKTTSLSSGFTKYVSPEHLTCLAVHPTEEYFATGDSKGVVRLWYCLNDSLAVNAKGVEKRTQTRSLHWHAHAVSSLSFTANGAYLLTGGEESVLVIWQLHTGKKEFVPRIGAPISTISISKSPSGEEEYLLGLADATHVFIGSASLRITRSYSNLKIDPIGSCELPSTSKLFINTPLAIQPHSSALILPSSHPSSLQIYSPSMSTLIGELEVCPSNRVSRRDEKPMVSSRVDHVCVSLSGDWMATIDSREDDVTSHTEVYLKIWLWDERDSSWMLNTRINRPHGTKKISGLAFSPQPHKLSPLYLISAGLDGRVKVWKLSNKISNEKAPHDVWISHKTLTFRSEIPTSVSWSFDASLFSVTMGCQIVLYNPASGLPRQVLNPTKKQKPRLALFTGINSSQILTVSEESITLWDLLQNAVLWQTTIPCHIDYVIAYPGQTLFAVFSRREGGQSVHETQISVFDTRSPVPIARWLIPFELRSIVWDSLRTGTGGRFIGISNSWKVVVFGDCKGDNCSQSVSNARQINAVSLAKGRTLFEDIFGVSTIDSTYLAVRFPASSSNPRGATKPKVFDTIFDTPTHLAPPLHDLTDTLLLPFLHERPIEPASLGIKPEDDDDDVVMEDDAITLSTSASQSRNAQEMDVLTQLFRTHSIAARPPKVNGKTNGLRPLQANGISSPKSVTTKSVQHRSEKHGVAKDVEIAHIPDSGLIQIGKKRKTPS